MRTNRITAMTWPEIQQYLSSQERPTVLLPISPMEEHGPHLPVGTDYLLTERIAQEIAQRYGCLVAPTIPLACCGISRECTGTYAIQERTLEAMVKDLVYEFGRKGFQRVYFVSVHFGFTIDVIRRAAADEMAQLETCKADVISLVEVAHFPSRLIQTADDRHAGEVETSGMQDQYPELVVYPLPPADYHSGGKLSKSGVHGDPLCATPEKGRAIFEAAVSGAVTWLNDH